VVLVAAQPGRPERLGLEGARQPGGKREAVPRTLTETFPQVRVVVDAPVQMEREVAAAPADRHRLRARPRRPAGRAGRRPAARPHATALDYNGGELRATGLALSRDEARMSPATAHPRATAPPPRATSWWSRAEDVR
jgi:general secretion pathway protein L